MVLVRFNSYGGIEGYECWQRSLTRRTISRTKVFCINNVKRVWIDWDTLSLATHHSIAEAY